VLPEFTVLLLATWLNDPRLKLSTTLFTTLVELVLVSLTLFTTDEVEVLVLLNELEIDPPHP